MFSQRRLKYGPKTWRPLVHFRTAGGTNGHLVLVRTYPQQLKLSLCTRARPRTTGSIRALKTAETKAANLDRAYDSDLPRWVTATKEAGMGFLQDLKFGLRALAKNPGFALLVILTVALGIGANTTIFSWINATLLNPVPGLTKANEVVSLTLSKPGENPFPFTYPGVEAMRDGQQSFTGIAACGFASISRTGKGNPERLSAMVASANYFDVLGVRPYLGRGFLPAEDEKPGGAPVAVISYRFWQTHFAADPNILGRTIELNQRPYSIVGVTPAAFQGSQTGVRTDLWVPIVMEAQFNPLGDLLCCMTITTSGCSSLDD